jgi:hypothetical protein
VACGLVLVVWVKWIVVLMPLWLVRVVREVAHTFTQTQIRQPHNVPQLAQRARIYCMHVRWPMRMCVVRADCGVPCVPYV